MNGRRARRVSVPLMALVMSLTLASSPRAADLFVDASVGADANDGLAWGSAKASIGAALDAATLTPEADIVWVAEGLYRERIVMPPTVQLRGSFPSGGGASDVADHASVIDGERLWRCVEFGPGTDESGINGFVIRNGWLPDRAGGGGILVTDAGPTISRCLLEDNEAQWGAAILLDLYDALTPSVPRLEQCVVRRGRVRYGTGEAVAIFLQAQGGPLELTMTDCVIEDTITAWAVAAQRPGSGLYVAPGRAAVRLERVIVRGNPGNGAFLGSTSTALEVRNCEFSDNAGTQLTLPLNTFASSSPPSSVTLRNCTVSGGVDRVRGYADSSGSMPDYDIRRCIFMGTWRHMYSSALESSLDFYSFPTPADVTDNIIVEGALDNTWGNFDIEPTFTPGRWGDYCLSQVAAGQPVDSFGVDQSVTLATDAGMDALTTRSDDVPDIGQADYGVHYWPLGIWGTAAEPMTIHRGVDPGSVPAWTTTDALPWRDAPGELSNSSEPLVFYNVEIVGNEIKVSKDFASDTVRLSF